MEEATSVNIPVVCTRCTVESVVDGDPGSRLQKVLHVKVDPGSERRSVTLQDHWASADVRVDDIINVLGEFQALSSSTSQLTKNINITRTSNLLILHPDLLLTVTALSNAPQCSRKPLLSSFVRASNDTSPALVWGSILHEVMQNCLSAGRWEEKYINEQIELVLQKNLLELVKLDMTTEKAKREIKSRALGLQTFASRYLSKSPKPEAILTDTRNVANQKSSLLAISQVLDLEEDIWSPTYGLKGKLDVTVQTTIFDFLPPAKGLFTSTPELTVSSGPLPFEIKTGRAVAGMEHRAQTMLYTLLAAERYGTGVPLGLLYYTQADEVVRVPANQNELRGLIMGRNEMAGYMMRRNKGWDERDEEDPGLCVEVDEPFLPPTIDDERLCKKCYALDACMLYRRAVESPIPEASPIYDTYELKTSHLTNSQASFFKQWEALLTMEEQDLVRFKRELWTMGAAEREKRGRCFASMILNESYKEVLDVTYSPESLSANMRIHRFTYCFVRSAHACPDGSNDLLSGHMGVGDPITVSVEPRLLALARGFILRLTPTAVVVGVDHVISLENIFMRLGSAVRPSVIHDVIFRIDKDELFGGVGRIRDNLAQLFYEGGDTRRLALVVDLSAPSFSVSQALPHAVTRYVEHLNEDQKRALEMVLSANDYALILGMPGSGKTTILAALIRVLVELGKTVLLTSYTHSAVDTILQKLDGVEFGILRLGNVDKVHPAVRKYTLEERRMPTNVEQLEQQLMTPPVVATTCLSIDHALFSRRKFDICIVDEASQITLPTCLGPLRFAETFVLVGDHFQLPPLVRNRNARKGGLDISLFRRLSDAHQSAVVELTHQYRMNDDIMLLSNHLIYDSRLRTGSEEVAKRCLIIPDRSYLADLHSSPPSACLLPNGICWIDMLVSESCKAVFVDSDLIPGRESRVGDLVQNETEAKLVHQLTETLIRCGVREDQIGIVTLYRQQVKLLTHLLAARKEVEVLTADRSQGRDKDCIIISMVRSNDSGQTGDLLKDWRRINVTFTRARSKLIIFGSRNTLTQISLMAQFFELMDRQGWMHKLPPGAVGAHAPAFQPTPRGTPKQTASGSDGKRQRRGAMNRGAEEDKRPLKKMRGKGSHSGVLAGRPVLQDLVNDRF